MTDREIEAKPQVSTSTLKERMCDLQNKFPEDCYPDEF